MARISEEISKAQRNVQGKTDANLANDSEHLGGIPADDYATKSYVQEYHNTKESAQKSYIDQQDQAMLGQAKEYTNSQIRNQDFSSFAKVTDVQALNKNLSEAIVAGDNAQKAYTDQKTQAIVNDVNANFQDVESSISSLNGTVNNLFTFVSDGKSQVAEAITDKGVSTSANDSFSTMASNIRSISSSGGSIDPNFVNTSDATATTSDILNGKTAYVKGEKIYGNLLYTGETEYIVNPDNPYPQKAEVELVYGEKENIVQITNKGQIAYSIFDISSDKNLLVAYDENDNKIKTYMQSQLTPGSSEYRYNILAAQYTFEDLGINADSDYTLSNIKMSIMNSDINKSGYECRVAILFSKKTSTEAKPYSICYVYRISTYGGTISIENKNFQAGTTNNIKNYIEYNNWKIVCNNSGTSATNTNAYALTWSSDTNTLAISTYASSIVYIEIYQFEDIMESDSTSNENAIKLKKSLTVGNSWLGQYRGLQFLNLDRFLIIRWTSSYGGGVNPRYTIYVLDPYFNTVKSYSDSASSTSGTSSILGKIAITNDALYGLDTNGLYSLIVNYSTGEITSQLISSTSIISTSTAEAYFSKDNKYLFVYENYDLFIYSFDVESKTFSLLHQSDIFNNEFRMLSNLKSLIYYKGVFYIAETIPDGKYLIGIKYNGNMYYNSIYNPGRFTAKQEDVLFGKSFIGQNGIPETGTMEVTE